LLLLLSTVCPFSVFSFFTLQNNTRIFFALEREGARKREKQREREERVLIERAGRKEVAARAREEEREENEETFSRFPFLFRLLFSYKKDI
jgi:hypothetical protein